MENQPNTHTHPSPTSILRGNIASCRSHTPSCRSHSTMARVDTLFTINPENLRGLCFHYPDSYTRCATFMSADDGEVALKFILDEFGVADAESLRLVVGPAEEVWREDTHLKVPVPGEKVELETAPLPSPFIVERLGDARKGSVDAHITVAPGADFVHSTFACDGCMEPLMRGGRFHCADCYNYDVCRACHAAGKLSPEHVAAGHVCVFVERPLERANHLVWPTLEATLVNACKNYNDLPAVGRRVKAGDGTVSYTWMSYRELLDTALNCAAGLADTLGPPTPDTMVGLCSKNCPEWVVCEFGVVSVPIVASAPQRQVDAIASKTSMETVVCTTATLHLFLTPPSITRIIVMDDGPLPSPPSGKTIMPLSDVFAAGAAARAAKAWTLTPRDPNAMHTIVFSSGSSGTPKGVMLSPAVTLARVAGHAHILGPAPVAVEYAPLAHTTARFNSLIHFLQGGQAAMFDGDVHEVWEDVAVVQPSALVMVPRLWAALQDKWKALAVSLGGEDAATKAIREWIGRRVSVAVTGGARTPPALLAFINRLFPNVIVGDGYGSTEVGGIASNGRILVSDFRLEETESHKAPFGEICVRSGDKAALGYYGMSAEEQAKSFTEDGYFRTGDIGYLDERGALRVVDRASNVVKLAQGEYVCLEDIASNLRGHCPLLAQVAVLADGLHSHTVAIGVLAVPAAQAIAAGVPDADLPTNADVMAAVMSQVRAAGVAAGMHAHEIPRGMHLVLEPFTEANGLLTATLKPALKAVHAAYAGAVEELYAASTKPSVAAMVAALEKYLGGGGHDADLGAVFGMDSISAAELAAAIHARLGAVVPISALLSTPSLSAIARVVRGEAGAGAGSSPSAAADMEAVDVAPSPDTGHCDWESTVRPGCVIVTGATGFLGVHLVEALVAANPDAPIVCLVRGVRGFQRLERWYAAATGAALPPTVAVVPADLSQPSLGMPHDAAERLFKSASAVWHCGAIVNWVLPYDAVRAVNVLGTATIAGLVAATPAILHFVSTRSVRTVVDASGYVTSKRVAEAAVRRSGAAYVIHQPAMVVGNAATGCCSPTDVFGRYIRTVVWSGMYPESSTAFEGTPVDVLAQRMVTQELTLGGVFTYWNPTSPTYAALGRGCGDDLRGVPYPSWRAVLVGDGCPLAPLASFFGETQPPGGVPTDDDGTPAVFDGGVTGRCVAWLKAQGKL